MSTKIRQSKSESREQYERRQAEIKQLLKEITAGIQLHNREAHEKGCHWGYVGDLASIAVTLTDIRDQLHHTGEYTEVQ